MAEELIEQHRNWRYPDPVSLYTPTLTHHTVREVDDLFHIDFDSSDG